MYFTMKIIFNWSFSIIIVLIINIRFRDKVSATEIGKSNVGVKPGESLLEDGKNKERVLSASETLEVNTVFFSESKRADVLLPSQSVIDDPALLNNIEVSSELSTTAEALVFPSADTAFELKNRVKSQFQHEITNSSNMIFSSYENEKEEYIVHAEPKAQMQTSAKDSVKAELNESEPVSIPSQEEPKKNAPQHEDIPSFSEWTQKQLAEAEKKKTDQNETTERFPKTRGKYRNKNYASPDCGAKIVAANPESLSSSSVLSSLKDEYMLNYCTNRIWFVVELCEAIQAKQLDLANFELFSSSPKHFSVSVSHRFPTRDWSNVGKFTAQDSRDVQTFNLHPHLFGKYIKVELHSHYGREQFCPISWVGIYGTSEYEVLAKEDERHSLPEDDEGDSYDEEMFGGHRRDSPKNLFSSATDAVLSIVKKATAPFMKTENNETEFKASESVTALTCTLCVCPRYITVCNNCSQRFYDKVFDHLSCQHFSLARLLSNSFVKRSIIAGESCGQFGLDFSGLRTGAPFPSNFLKNPGQEVNYVSVMLENSVLAALCNVLAVSENKVVVNVTLESGRTLKNVTKKEEPCESVVEFLTTQPPSSTSEPSSTTSGVGCSQSTPSQSPYVKTSIFTEIFKPSERFSEKIEPTKTLTEDEVKMLPPSMDLSESTTEVSEEKSTELPNGAHVTSTATPSLVRERRDAESSAKKEQHSHHPSSSPQSETKPEGKLEIEGEDKSGNVTNQDSTLESIIKDINAIEKAVDSPASSVAPSASNLPTESIFLRLANRIKNLEINMSLSSTYLEELSKRYRTQLEVLSKTLNLTIQKVEERTKVEEEKERKREKEMMLIRMQLTNLTRDVGILIREKNSWSPRASSVSQHIFFISVEILFVWIIFNYRRRRAENKHAADKIEPAKKINKRHKRRKSLEGVRGHETPKRKSRRPSDEALEIALSGSYQSEALRIDKKRKRRKKDSKCSINTIHLKRKKSEVTVSEILVENPASNSTPEKVGKFEEVDVCCAAEEKNGCFASTSSVKSFPQNSNGAAEANRDFVFVKTALAARTSRLKSVPDGESLLHDFSRPGKAEQEYLKKESQRERKTPSSGFKKYMKKFF